ncbi:hypothetical protein J3A83DRAFT_141597 [Scleroderma citrinum]
MVVDHPTLVDFPLLRALPGSIHNIRPSPLQSTPMKECIIERMLHVLFTTLEHKTHAAPLPPTLFFAICDILQDNEKGVSGHSLLPWVLSKLRAWRFLDSKYRCTREALHLLASELAGIREGGSPLSKPIESMDGASIFLPAPTVMYEIVPGGSTALFNPTLRGQDENIPWPSVDDSPCASGLNLAKRDRLKVSMNQHPNKLRSHRRNVSSEYRSGCAACRRPRDSSSSVLRTPLVEISPLRNAQDDTDNLLLCTQSKPSSIPSFPSRGKSNRPNNSVSSLRKAKVDENMSPLLLKLVSVKSGIAQPRPNIPSKMSPTSLRPPRTSSHSSLTPIGRALHRSHVPNRLVDSHQTGNVDRQTDFQASFADCQSRLQGFSRTQGRVKSMRKYAVRAKSTDHRRSLGIVADFSGQASRLHTESSPKGVACSTRPASIDMGYLQRRLHKGKST